MQVVQSSYRTERCPLNADCGRRYKSTANALTHCEKGGCGDDRKTSLDRVYHFAKQKLQRFVNRFGARRKIIKNRPEIPYRCPICKDEFKYLSGAIRHQWDKHLSGKACKTKSPTNESQEVYQEECPVASTCQVHTSLDDGKQLQFVLNLSCIERNNNKYYKVQVMKTIDGDQFIVWMSWGRNGYKGQSKLIDFWKYEAEAISILETKFHEKTRNFWLDRDNFNPVKGRYTMVDIDPTSQDKKPKSKLEPEVQDLMEMIFDLKAMELAASEQKFDIEKFPLGKLSKAQILDGYKVLKSIENLIKNREESNDRAIVEFSNKFHTKIPHNFGYDLPPLIDTVEKFEEKMELLRDLSCAKIGCDLMNECDENSQLNPMDKYYNKLKCDLKHLGKDTEDFRLVESYIQSNHSAIHDKYAMEVTQVFKCTKHSPYNSKLKNRKILFHGSRTTNICGILSQGLIIDPEEAPKTGNMFGKGVYFADVSSKSANYCKATPQNPWGILILCEVALGNENKLLNANVNADKLPKGKHSVKGCGEFAPDPKNQKKIDGNVVVPMGPVVKVMDKHELIHNEYVVYNTDQIKMRYIAKIKFHFK